MSVHFPGTVIERQGRSSREFLFGMFTVTKGLMLSQVREITGLDATTIQNWINRGWVKNPVDKRYTQDHLAGILIIHMLRDVMKMESIAKLMTYLKSDQQPVVSEAQLYHYVCDILDIISYDVILSEEELVNMINQTLLDYKEPFLGAKAELVNVLHIILIYYAAAIVKHKGDIIFQQILTT